MRILFVENRYSTYLWNAIAKELIKEGHQIFWIVQNKEFTPDSGTIFHLDIKSINFNNKKKVYDSDIKKVIKADRGLNYYNLKSDDHLFSVKEQIDQILGKIKPEIGFGECTLYHEMLTMQAFRKKNLPYFFPTSCRFPINRFSFYSYDTLLPFSGSNEEINVDEALKIAKQIGTRNLAPAYITNANNNPPGFVKKTKDKIKIFRGYVNGERYNTPSLMTKFQLSQTSKNNIKSWDSLAIRDIEKGNDFIILYPLQMQPETSIDVWATDFNKQYEVIQKILENTPVNIKIAIKPNPTSKLEIREELIEMSMNNPRIIPLHHSVNMKQVIDKVDAVVTATGTIALECIFANKPIITLVRSYFNTAKNCLYLNDFSELNGLIVSIQNKNFPSLSDKEKAAYFNYLNKVSFKGTISCTFWRDDVIQEDNLSDLKKAFLSVIHSIKND